RATQISLFTDRPLTLTLAPAGRGRGDYRGEAGGRAMEFGIHIRAQGWLTERANLIAVAQRADALGYRYLGLVDHVVLPRDVATRYPYTEDGIWPGTPTGECFDVLGMMCFLAGCTEKIKLLSSVLVVPHRPAVIAAKMLATADRLSGGRVIAGIGAGWMREEFDALGAPAFEERGAVTDEFLAACQSLWTEDAPAFHGRYVTFDNVIFRPKPLQPKLPIWVGGESAPSLRRTVRFGDAWYPVSNNQQVPLDTPDRLAAGIGRLARAAEKEGRDPASIDIAYLWFKPVQWNAQPAADGRRLLFTGSAADMQQDVAALARAGARRIIVLLQAPSLGETLERLERFAEDVMRRVAA
ncbi:MAG: TIGR03619 family F420-dependent LLM class oxidoreductase, partial [Acetobacteraceae bacterium]